MRRTLSTLAVAAAGSAGNGMLKPTVVTLQGWGSSQRSGGGWGDDSSSAADGGWGKSTGGSGGGWGSSRGSAAGSSGGGWGSSSGSSSKSSGGWGSSGGSSSEGTSGGWGSGSSSTGGKGGWGDSGSAPKKSWGGEDKGWGGAPTGASRGGRGGGRGRGGFGGGDRRGGEGGDGNIWGKPTAVDAESWGTAPPSFSPPVRRVDPLTLTAVEVEIDGIKKLVGQRVQLTGLSDDTTWHTLKDHLRQVGEISFCKIFSGGRAMVEFVTPEEAARAIHELQGSELEGATIFIREDREDTVLINTRRKIREAREAQLRARKAAEEAKKAAKAKSEESEEVA